MLILSGNMCRPQSMFERVESRPGITVDTARCTVELNRLVEAGCVYRQMARCYQRINAHSSSHDIIINFVDHRVLRPGLRKLHVRDSNRSQRRVQK